MSFLSCTFRPDTALGSPHDLLDPRACDADSSVQKTVQIDLALIDHHDALLGDVELYLTRTAKVDDPQAYFRLQTIAAFGEKILRGCL